jgi:hypothetical protein
MRVNIEDGEEEEMRAREVKIIERRSEVEERSEVEARRLMRGTKAGPTTRPASSTSSRLLDFIFNLNSPTSTSSSTLRPCVFISSPPGTPSFWPGTLRRHSLSLPRHSLLDNLLDNLLLCSSVFSRSEGSSASERLST